MPRPDPIAPRSLPSLDELRAWVAPGDGAPRITVHLPIQRGIPEVRQNAPLLERAAREVEQRLLDLGAPADAASDSAAALGRVDLDVARLGPAARALAVLLQGRELRAVALPVDAPYAVAVARSFALRPLLGALHRQARYRVLAVSINRVACYEGGPDGLRETPLPGVPASLPDALGAELTGKELRMRGTGRGGAAPVYYSHGSGKDERKLDLARFHEALARTLGTALVDGALPLVLVATEEHQGGLRAGAKLPGLLDEGVTGSFDHATPAELAARCLPVVERWLARRAEEAAGAWERARNRGKAMDLLDDVAAAALAGRVLRLWVDAARALPGRIDPNTGQVVASEGADDVLDALCELVLARAGDVIPVEAGQLPSSTGAAAELR
jgi:hypothetical protein